MKYLYQLIDKVFFKDENAYKLREVKKSFPGDFVLGLFALLIPFTISLILALDLNIFETLFIITGLVVFSFMFAVSKIVFEYIYEVKNKKNEFLWGMEESFPEFLEIISDIEKSAFNGLNEKYLKYKYDVIYVATERNVPYSALFEGINLNDKKLAVQYLLSNCNFTNSFDVEHSFCQIEEIYLELFGEIKENLDKWLESNESTLPTYKEIKAQLNEV